MKDFVALARSSPEKFNASVPPIGTTPQLQMALLKVKEKLPNLEEVVFKGGGDAVAALIAGTVQICSGATAPAQPHIKAGTLRGLAISAETRWPDLPDVPTMIESGYPVKVLSTKEMKDKMFQNGFLVRAKGADAAWARVTKEMDTFKQIVDQAGIKKL
jgi:tripartite-type tricarboxylate transporter receptor subunit TctC